MWSFLIVYIFALITVANQHSASANQRITAGTTFYSGFGFSYIQNDSEYPYMASLQWRNQHICGCILIRSTAILTAAHCVKGKKPKEFVVLAGTLRIGNHTNFNPTSQLRTVNNIIIHDGYNNTHQHEHDIAVVYLDHPFVLNDYVNMIKLTNESDHGIYIGRKVRILGWKLKSEKISNDLLHSDAFVVRSAVCKKSGNSVIAGKILCLRQRLGGTRLCFGNSAGMAVRIVGDNPKNHTLLGVTSSIKKNKGETEDSCVFTGESVFTDISALRSWIDATVSVINF